MEQKTPKFHLRLNFFDGIVLVLALVAAVVMAWMALRPAASAPDSTAAGVSTVRYTVCFQRWFEGTSGVIQPGDQLADNIKNLAIGQVVSVRVQPAQVRSVDMEARVSRQTELEGYEDVFITVESPCVITDESITLSGSYILRVGQMAYVKGEGYLGSGPVMFIEEVAG